jgi:hypothetical protein
MDCQVSGIIPPPLLARLPDAGTGIPPNELWSPVADGKATQDGDGSLLGEANSALTSTVTFS